MKLIITLCLGLLFTSTSFGQQSDNTTNIGGVNREYITYLPVNFDPQTESLPLVIVYHGLTQTNDILTLAGFNQIADTARLIIMYPQGLQNSLGQTAWNNGTAVSPNADDIAFTNFMIDTAMLAYNIDLNKVYAAGVSMGSIMCYNLACNLNDRFAAIGAVFGPMSTQDITTCNPSYSTPIIHFHGTDDGTVPYDENALPTLSLATETIAFWENQKNCSGTFDSIRIPDTAADNLTTDRFVYNNCNADGSLELWRTNGGDHDYYIQPLNDFTHFVEAWMFMRQWEHPNPRNTAGIDEASKEYSIYPNPTSSILNVGSVEANFDYIIYNLSGQILLQGRKNAGSINVETLSPGAYIIQIDNATYPFFVE